MHGDDINNRRSLAFGERLTLSSKKKTNAPVDFILCIGDENDDEPMFQKIHARYEERGLVPRHGPASAAGVMGMKVDERHRQGDMQTPKHGKSFKTTNTTEENIKEKQGRAKTFSYGGKRSKAYPSSSGSSNNLSALNKGSYNDLSAFQRSESKDSLSSSNSALSSHKSSSGTRTKVFTATVGAKPSSARYFVHSSDDVGRLLDSLAKVSRQSRLSMRSRSMGDLKGFNMGARRKNAASNLPEDSGSNPKTEKETQSSGEEYANMPLQGSETGRLSFAKKRQLQRNMASASMVNLADMANKRVGLGQILEEVNEMRSSSGTKIPSNADEYLNNLDDDEDEGGVFF
eukprot:g7646.t1